MDATAKNMIEFFDSAGQTGRIKQNTARSLAAALRQIFAIDENWEQIDVTQLDVDAFLARFRNLHGLKYKQHSLAEYERRFKRAIELYLEYLHNPKGWKFDGHSRSRSKSQSKKTSGSKSTQPHVGDTVETVTVGIAPSGIQMMDYPFPLRDACVVRLRLPVDLKVSEVERLMAFMQTLTVDYPASSA